MPTPRTYPPRPRAWKPTHRITFTPASGSPEVWLVMFVRESDPRSWSGYTEEEWANTGCVSAWSYFTDPPPYERPAPQWRGMWTPRRAPGSVTMERLK